MGASDLDREFLEELLDGDREFAQELFETYCESADAAVADAELKLSQADAENVFRPFHTLKGASASVGLTGLQEMARRLELQAKAGELEACKGGLSELKEAIREAKEALDRYLQSLPE